MRNTIKNIERYYNVLNKALFYLNSDLSYDRIQDAFISLCDVLNNTDTDENVWCIGEYEICSLADMIVGAYWHFVECHTGQYSKSYQALSMLGEIYNPNRESVDTKNPTYQALNNFCISNL